MYNYNKNHLAWQLQKKNKKHDAALNSLNDSTTKNSSN